MFSVFHWRDRPNQDNILDVAIAGSAPGDLKYFFAWWPPLVLTPESLDLVDSYEGGEQDWYSK